MRLTALLLLIALLALSGCGGSSEETTTSRSPAKQGTVSVEKMRADWERDPSCKRPPGASRWGCSVGPYRCQAVVVGRGWSVGCAKVGESLAFRVPRD